MNTWKNRCLYPIMIGVIIKDILLKKHRVALRLMGVTPFHRQSFNLLGEQQLNIDLVNILNCFRK